MKGEESLPWSSEICFFFFLILLFLILFFNGVDQLATLLVFKSSFILVLKCKHKFVISIIMEHGRF